MLAPPNENCDAPDALSRFASEDPTVHPPHSLTKYLDIEPEVRESEPDDLLAVDVAMPAPRAVPRPLPVADVRLLRGRLVDWFARQPWRPSAAQIAAGAEVLGMMRGEVKKLWLAWGASRTWRSAMVTPSAATLGTTALAAVLATALLLAVMVPEYSASTGERQAPAVLATPAAEPAAPPVPAEGTPQIVTLSESDVVAGSRLGLKVDNEVVKLVVVSAPESQSLPKARVETRVTPKPVRARVAAAPPAQAVATTWRPSPAPQRAEEGNDAAAFVGSLAIDSEPAGAMVFINQKAVGETPVRLKGLSAGSRVVRIEYPGYERWTAAVLVAAEKQARVSARLQSVRAEQ